MEKSKLTEADILLGINKLNSQKLKVLLEMSNLESCGKRNDKDFFELLDIYKMIYDVQKQKIFNLDYSIIQKLTDIVYSINPNIKKDDAVEEFFNNSDKYLIIKRTLIDLGESPLLLYKTNSSILDFFNNLFNNIGLSMNSSGNENEIDSKSIDEFMVYEFFNNLLSFIQRKIEKVSNDEERKALLEIKYRLIFLVPDLEKRALLEYFLISDEFVSIDTITIETTGIQSDKYNQDFNYSVACYLGKLIGKCLDKNDFNLLEELLISTMIVLLNDKFYQQILNDIERSAAIYDVTLVKEIIIEARKLKMDNNNGFQKNLF